MNIEVVQQGWQGRISVIGLCVVLCAVSHRHVGMEVVVETSDGSF